ncbi:MAG: hypothetical protein Q9197_006565 [Variospora fuerteventurae]
MGRMLYWFQQQYPYGKSRPAKDSRFDFISGPVHLRSNDQVRIVHYEGREARVFDEATDMIFLLKSSMVVEAQEQSQPVSKIFSATYHILSVKLRFKIRNEFRFLLLCTPPPLAITRSLSELSLLWL